MTQRDVNRGAMKLEPNIYRSPRLFFTPYRAEIAERLEMMARNRRRHMHGVSKWHIGELVKHTHTDLARVAQLRDAADFWSPLP